MIKRKSLRRMTPLAKKVAAAHNEAHKLAGRLRSLARDVSLLEIGIAKERLERSDDAAFK